VTIGLLCDGCRYLAADDVLEWDIFRTGILEDQGWILRRIWTPHFFRDPAGDVHGIDNAAKEFVAAEKPVDAIPTSVL
jgi:very-short-patch-repair endonuclease